MTAALTKTAKHTKAPAATDGEDFSRFTPVNNETTDSAYRTTSIIRFTPCLKIAPYLTQRNKPGFGSQEKSWLSSPLRKSLTDGRSSLMGTTQRPLCARSA